MKKRDLDKLLKEGFSEAVKAIAVKPKRTETQYQKTVGAKLSPLDEYNVENHPIFDKAIRPDKHIEGGKVDKKLNRIGLAIEAYIASRAAAFLCGYPVKYIATPEGDAQEKMWQAFKRVNEENKLDYRNLALLEIRMSETEVAEIWYFQPLEEGDDYWQGTSIKKNYAPRLFVAAPSLNDKLWPVWDTERLIAFAREWEEITDGDKTVKHFDLFRQGEAIELVEKGGTWEEVIETTPDDSNEAPTQEPPPEVDKLMVIYHVQPDVEHAKVRAIIRRLENIYSNFADSNDRFAFPWLLLEGKPKDLPQGVADKVLQLDNNGKASFLVPPNAPEAIKLEVEQLWRELHRLTDTVDITNDALTSLGQTTGPALEFRFMPAHLKAAKHAGTFGECLQRRINLIKHMIVACDPSLKEGLTLQIKPQFDYFLPKDVQGIVNYVATATGAGVMAKETGAGLVQAALGGDGKAEYDRILAEPKPDALQGAFEDAA